MKSGRGVKFIILLIDFFQVSALIVDSLGMVGLFLFFGISSSVFLTLVIGYTRNIKDDQILKEEF